MTCRHPVMCARGRARKHGVGAWPWRPSRAALPKPNGAGVNPQPSVRRCTLIMPAAGCTAASAAAAHERRRTGAVTHSGVARHHGRRRRKQAQSGGACRVVRQHSVNVRTTQGRVPADRREGDVCQCVRACESEASTDACAQLTVLHATTHSGSACANACTCASSRDAAVLPLRGGLPPRELPAPLVARHNDVAPTLCIAVATLAGSAGGRAALWSVPSCSHRANTASPAPWAASTMADDTTGAGGRGCGCTRQATRADFGTDTASATSAARAK